MEVHSSENTQTTDHNPDPLKTHTDSRPGKVYLIGAGPGDPELITVKGLRYLRKADVVLYDRLVSPLLLDETRPEAELVFVGKGPGCHAMPQQEINQCLVEYARQRQVVVRLKGGDPFIFGRGGEEAQALVEANIPFEIVPGVSSISAVPAYAGIPITHRDYTTSVTIVTGHESRSPSPGVNWQALAALGGTLVVLMGVKALPHFTQSLIEGGMDPQLPAAVIQEGTTQKQRVVTAPLIEIAQRAGEAGLTSPAVTVIGRVVEVRDILQWFDEMKVAHPITSQTQAC